MSSPSHLRRLAHAVDDAVYLDEDAYNQVQPKVAYLKTIQVRSQMLEVATTTDSTVVLELEHASCMLLPAQTQGT